MISPSGTCGIIILAAGNSSRLGKAKQLLQYNNRSLIQSVTDEAIKVAGKAVVVVLGANKAPVEAELSGFDMRVAYNQDWQEGMASSISCGLTELTKLYPGLENVIITVCDQPFLISDVFFRLIQKHSASGKNIIASAYNDTLGVPVLFNKIYFGDLLALSGQQGAKKLLEQFTPDVDHILFPEGNIDIDTAGDYEMLVGMDE